MWLVVSMATMPLARLVAGTVLPRVSKRIEDANSGSFQQSQNWMQGKSFVTAAAGVAHLSQSFSCARSNNEPGKAWISWGYPKPLILKGLIRIENSTSRRKRGWFLAAWCIWWLYPLYPLQVAAHWGFFLGGEQTCWLMSQEACKRSV